ncbi:MAG: ATP-dependent Clp protease adaptor ClpS [Sulfurimonas sp. RIFOXYD12_FULL_33_39]|uniref:ATP-dependent Clp protease adaptor ClpS n=1 Tax=unclassified Sulfurimonas TaxID=2623549 RepID=UPI0008CCFC92|nr:MULTISPECIES: ATP-dependent Clp protease adaptor ClpS [unclassified Sulfurimonas]OHE04977.1 MAG: ATP-dependent Clp protease adaptor ClpS [Sulfurimonas sp. RIFCSPLOWO2_12_FULL_34_6]OHE08803.1 MAG: ATP-dependent Clp protease adaptor ClpS [Sulfurimonas sp. RIFOXYD12_FULL_33_39]OHE14088.1 MAG: ATP-dependent Clp protease adaptor ClpS [Sulfurimonas sp. RIFOXYD2_FULL_34_21]DAB27410.1 MAG TPA: ATP-dependent Clp protease adaptor ClpS [Sulfurimonas sp. UBA10385]
MATNIDLEVINEISIKDPKKYKVLLLNDDYTIMEFVIDVLKSVFHKSPQEAEAVMLEIHKNDKGVCGIYTHEIAETKVMQVHKKARDSGFPLKAEMEEE